MADYINGQLPDDLLQWGSNGALLVPGALEAWNQMVLQAAAAGVNLHASEGYRDLAGQQAAWQRYQAGGNLAATPGTSKHGWGLAVDVNTSQEGAVDWLRAYGEYFGFRETVKGEPWHWEYVGGDAPTSGLAGIPAPSVSRSSTSGAGPDGGTMADNSSDPGGGVSTLGDRYPAQGELLRGPQGIVLRYETYPGVFVEWEVTDMDALARSGYNAGAAKPYSQPQGQLVEGGNAAELGELTYAGYDSIREFMDATIGLYFSPNDPARNNPEIQAVITRIMANPDAPGELIDAWIQQTDYWLQTNERKKSWNSLSPAEQDVLVQEQVGLIEDEYWSTVGARLSLGDSRLAAWARQVASGVKTYTEVVREIRDLAMQNPESPYSRSIRQEGINQRQFAADTENNAEAYRQEALRWGIDLGPASSERWARQIQLNEYTEADFQNYLRDTAQVMFPWKDRDVAAVDAAAPWLEAYRRTLEIGDVNMLNPDIMRAMQNGTSLPDFEAELRSKPEWMSTKNARDTLADAVGRVGEMMGFV